MARTSGYFASASIVLALCAPQQATSKFITFLVPGAAHMNVVGISNNGEVIGTFNDHSHGQHGFLRAKDGTFTTIDVPGNAATYLSAIRDDGTIVGFCSVATDGGYESLGFIRTPSGRIKEFRAPRASSYTSPVSISSTGWIAGTGGRGGLKFLHFGFLRDPSGHFTEFGRNLLVHAANANNTTAGTLFGGPQWHGFVRTPDGTIAQFDPDGSTNTSVTAINDSDTATGTAYTTVAGSTGFIRTADGAISTFDAGQNAVFTTPTGLNKAGAIVGSYRDNDMEHGFVRAPDGTITTIDVPGALLTEPSSINDKGQAAGLSLVGRAYRGFIWKPDRIFAQGLSDVTAKPPKGDRQE